MSNICEDTSLDLKKHLEAILDQLDNIEHEITQEGERQDQFVKETMQFISDRKEEIKKSREEVNSKLGMIAQAEEEVKNGELENEAEETTEEMKDGDLKNEKEPLE